LVQAFLKKWWVESSDASSETIQTMPSNDEPVKHDMKQHNISPLMKKQ
jgi:hypothetical protein